MKTTGLVIGIAVLFLLGRHFQLRYSLARYIDKLSAQGEPMRFSQVLPPLVAPEQNGVAFIEQALTNLDHKNILTTNWLSPMLMISPGRAIVAWKQVDIRCDSATNTWEDLNQELTKSAPCLDQFQSLASHPVLDFHLDYERTPSLPLTHVSLIRHSMDLLQASAINNLHFGKPAESCANIRTMLQVVRGLTQERELRSQRLRLAIVRLGFSASWEVLQHPDTLENTLSPLQQDWQTLDLIVPFENALKTDRVQFVAELDYLRLNPQEMWDFVMAGSATEAFLCRNCWRWFWSYTDERRTLEMDQVFLEAARIAEKEQSYEQARSYTQSKFQALGLETPAAEKNSFRIDVDALQTPWLFSEDARDTFVDLRRCLTTETARNIVITAIALKRFELRFQRLPDNLEKLIPDFLNAVPIDLMDGKPLRYRPNSDGTFLLYSVGDNAKDDGGNPSFDKHNYPGHVELDWQSPYALDQVWPKPATSKEVKKYYSKLAKLRR